MRVTDPVACSQAHIYCRECALSSLITQKAGIDAQRRELERWEADDARRRSDAREAARARVVADFEKGMGLSSVRKAAVTASSAAASTDLAGEIERRQLEAEEKAAAAIEAEESEARKAKIAAFWLPSLTPEAPLGPLKAVKLQPLCSVGAAPHPFSRKTLLPVILNYPGGSDKPHCPSCAKELTNSSGGVLLSSREPGGGGDEPAKKKKKVEGKKDKKEKEAPAVCGHVVCKTCAETVVAPAKACPVCDAVVEAAGMLPLGKEGELEVFWTQLPLTTQVPASLPLEAQRSRRRRSHSGCRV